MNFKEDPAYLKKWIQEARAMAEQIQIRSREERCLSLFSISSTAKVPPHGHPYLTPFRRITHGFVGGAVVFSQTQALLLCQMIDGLVDMVLVDAEKKIGMAIDVDRSVLKELGVAVKESESKSRFQIEMGNLSAACEEHVHISKVYEYKANDMTAESVWYFLSSHFKVLSGKKIAVIGSGNVGFKLALKLVESGSEVHMVRRDITKGMLLANAINLLKPPSTVAKASFTHDPLQASLFSHAIVGCTNGAPVINWAMIQCLHKDGIVVDVGKGSIEGEAIANANQHGIPTYRTDISSGLDGAIAAILRNQDLVENKMGRRRLEEQTWVVSGGFFGQAGDVIVDNFRTPTQVIGVCDGYGDVVKKRSPEDEQRIDKVREEIRKNEPAYR